MEACNVVEHKYDMNINNGTWAFKFKKFSNGTEKSFKSPFLLKGINSWKGLILLPLSNRALFAWCISVRTDFAWNLSKLMSLQSLFMLLLKKMRKSMWGCLLDLGSAVQMESSRFFVSRKLFMTCFKVLVPFGNIPLKNLENDAFLKLLLIHASLLFFGHYHL